MEKKMAFLTSFVFYMGSGFLLNGPLALSILSLLKDIKIAMLLILLINSLRNYLMILMYDKVQENMKDELFQTKNINEQYDKLFEYFEIKNKFIKFLKKLFINLILLVGTGTVFFFIYKRKNFNPSKAKLFLIFVYGTIINCVILISFLEGLINIIKIFFN